MDFNELTEEEFESLHAQEMDILEEMNSEQQLLNDFLSSQTESSNIGSVLQIDESSIETAKKKVLQDGLNETLDSGTLPHIKESTSETTRKRLFQDMLNDIPEPEPKRTKSLPLVGYQVDVGSKEDPDLSLIDQIVAHRDTLREAASFKENALRSRTEKRRKWVCHSKIPAGDFQSVTTEDGKRLYLDVVDDVEFSAAVSRVKDYNLGIKLLENSYHELRMEAENELLSMNAEVTECLASEETEESKVSNLSNSADGDLWVTKYRPKNYLDLLSDEATNRTVLQWMKLWDKVVFGAPAKPKKVKEPVNKSKQGKFKFYNKFAPEIIEEFDELNRPQQKAVLLCGPPGLGKTTLAHIIASHAGYNVVEMNASDDRTVDSFRTNLENATSMKSVFGADPRPNCLIIDEIDGAPAPSINYLVNLLQAKNVKSDKSKKNKKDKFNLLRPVICICNDLYTPSLRPLRLISLLIHFPPTQSSRLAQRLHCISRRQNMNTDLTVLLSLCNKTENDIRSCLSVLQFVSATSSALRLKDLEGVAVGQKDYQRSLFKIWQDIFTIPRPKREIRANPHHMDSNAPAKILPKVISENSLTARFRNILKSVQSCGEYEKLTLGWFENYLNTKFKHTHLEPVREGLDWATMTDILRTETLHSQAWSLGGYAGLSFVAFHFGFAAASAPKLQYPMQFSDFQSKLTKANSIIDTLIAGMSLNIRAFLSRSALIQDVLPYFSYVLQPSFRPVNVQLFSAREKTALTQVIGAMIDYNLTYLQERTPEGTYIFTLDPNVEEVTQFSCLPKTKIASYSTKQLIAREVELEKVRRAEQYFKSSDVDDLEEPKSYHSAPVKDAVPNHLKKLEVKRVDSNILKNNVGRDFFGRVITSPRGHAKSKKKQENFNIWYKFKEGYSNAVRRNIPIKVFFS